MSLYTSVFDTTKRGNILILDGGTGTELEKRGVPMDPGAWCGVAALEHAGILKRIHLDYIFSGADVITTNTYSSSRHMVSAAGFALRAVNSGIVVAQK